MNPLYFVETQHPRLGRWFLELDRDANSRENVVRIVRGGEVVIKVLEVCESEGTCRDVTAEIVAEAQDAMALEAAE